MKINAIFKTPDAAHYAIESAKNKELVLKGISRDKVGDFKHSLQEFLSHWITNGECIEVEFDTETLTATVKRQR